MGNAGRGSARSCTSSSRRVGAAAGAAGFPQGHLVVAGVDGSRGRENDLLAAHVRHDLGQNQRGIEVIVVVTPRLGDGFSHGLQAREVDDGGNFIFRENFPQERLVPYVSLVEFDFPAGNGSTRFSSWGWRCTDCR